MADSGEIFEQGIQEYNLGNYENALNLFKTVEDSGFINAQLYYNLGNCYYKLDQKGMAVASFLRARRLDPRNEDIKANLLFVRSTLRDKYQDSLQNPIWEFIKTSSLYFKANELTMLLCALYILLVIVLIYRVFYKERNTAIIVVALSLIFLMAVGGSMLGVNLKLNYHTPQAVILEPEVDILSGPGATGDVRFTAHEGLTFSILRQESGYYEGIFANKLKGWVEISKAHQF
jgi:tetratricopeptide (TPR) repeat protein